MYSPSHIYQVGLLAAVGVTEVQVAVAPSVAVLSTGGLSFPWERNLIFCKETNCKSQGRVWNRATSETATRQPSSHCSSRRVSKQKTPGWPRTTSNSWQLCWSLLWKALTSLSQPGVSPWETATSWDRFDRLGVKCEKASSGDLQVLVDQFGAEIHFARVAMKPGKPTTLASLNFNGKRRLVLGLPGNPVSLLALKNQTCNKYHYTFRSESHRHAL